MVELSVLFISGLDGGEWSTSCSGYLTPGGGEPKSGEIVAAKQNSRPGHFCCNLS
jgi:hypothetical protein